MSFEPDLSPKWNEKMPRMVFQMALLGLNDQQMSDVIGVSRTNFSEWKKKYPDLLDALVNGKSIADAKVAEALYKCAIGYEYEEEAVFKGKNGSPEVVKVNKYKGPDAWAATKWLTTRQRELWKDTPKDDVKIVNFTNINLSGLSTDELMLAEKIGLNSITDGTAGSTTD